MTHFTISEAGVENLDKYSRTVRALVGAGLIAFVMTTPEAPLGWYAVLPLLAVYPFFTAITGWDPVKALFRHPTFSRRALNFSQPVRIAVGAVGVALVGSVYAAAFLDVSLGVWAVLPIVGIYPVFAAIAGMDPVTALCNLDRNWIEPQPVSGKPQSTVVGVIKGSKSTASEKEDRQHPKAA